MQEKGAPGQHFCTDMLAAKLAIISSTKNKALQCNRTCSDPSTQTIVSATKSTLRRTHDSCHAYWDTQSIPIYSQDTDAIKPEPNISDRTPSPIFQTANDKTLSRLEATPPMSQVVMHVDNKHIRTLIAEKPHSSLPSLRTKTTTGQTKKFPRTLGEKEADTTSHVARAPHERMPMRWRNPNRKRQCHGTKSPR